MLHVLKEEMRPASSRASTCVHCNSEHVRDANYSQLLLLLRHGPLRRGTDSAVPQLPQRPIRLAPVPAVPQARAPCSMRHATLVRRNWRLEASWCELHVWQAGACQVVMYAAWWLTAAYGHIITEYSGGDAVAGKCR